MASANLAVYITGQGKDLINEFNKVGNAAEKSGKKTSSGWSKASSGIKLAGAAIAGTAVAIGVASVKAAIDDQKAQKLLATSLKNTTGATKTQISAVEDWITKTQNASGVMDDDLRPALSTLLRATGDTTKAQSLLKTAMDVSAATGKPLAAVTLALGKAYQGNVTGLAKLGIQVKKAVPDTERIERAQLAAKHAQESYTEAVSKYGANSDQAKKASERYKESLDKVALASEKTKNQQLPFNEVLKQLQDKMGGSTAAAASTMAGKMAIARAQFEDAKETIGGALIPVLAKLAEIAGKVVAWLTKHQTVAKALAVVVGGVLLAAVVAYTASMVSAAAATLAATWPILAVIAAVAALTAAVIYLWTHWDQVWTWISEHKAIAAVIALLVPIVPIIFGIVAAAKFLQANWETIWGAITSTVQTASDIIMTVLDPIIDTIEKLIDLESKIAGGIGGVTSHLPHSILGHHIPGTATGGIVTGPQVRLVGEAGPEAIIPLSRGRGLGNTYVINSYSLDPATAEASIVRILREHTDKNGFIRGVRTA